MTENVYNHMDAVSTDVVNQIAGINQRHFQTLHSLAELAIIKDEKISLADKQAELAHVPPAAGDNCENIAFYDAEGNAIVGDGRVMNFATRAYFQEAFNGHDYVSDPTFSTVTDSVLQHYSVPVYNTDNKIIGAVVMVVSGNTILSTIEAIDMGISISQTNTEQGLEFVCVDDEIRAKGIELTSYDWILSYMNEDERLSTEKAFVLTNEKKSALEYNGFYALSLVAHDSDGNMYAETAYFTVVNENGKPMHNIQNGPVLEVTLPSDYSQGKLKIEQSATENNGTKFTVLNLPEEYEYCMWTFEDEVVSRTASSLIIA